MSSLSCKIIDAQYLGLSADEFKIFLHKHPKLKVNFIFNLDLTLILNVIFKD